MSEEVRIISLFNITGNGLYKERRANDKH